MSSLSRRAVLKLAGWLSAVTGAGRWSQPVPTSAAENSTSSGSSRKVVGHWQKSPDRVWLGAEFWANPMEDWRIVDGAAECLTTGGDRNVHLLTHQLRQPTGTMEMSVRVTRVADGSRDGGAGFRIGVRSDIDEYRSSCFARNGIRAGLIDQTLVLGRTSQRLPEMPTPTDYVLLLTGRPTGDGTSYELTLSLILVPDAAVTDAAVADSVATSPVAKVTAQVPVEQVLGNVAIVSNFDPQIRKGDGARYRFRDWAVGGEAFQVSPDQRFGPILWSMYTLNDTRRDAGRQLKLTALTPPLEQRADQNVELQVQRDGDWTVIGTALLDPDAWTATFTVSNWKAETDTPYRLVYRERHTDGSETEADWTGVIRAEPAGRPLRLGALTCQNDYAFPYEPVVGNLERLDPDMLYFSGDQIYESHGGYGVIRDDAELAILNYLRKFYQFGWAFRSVLRDRPTVCIPDDHDVFQGNLWGEAGKRMDAGTTSSEGGYRQPARMVNVVHRTNVSHHPAPFDPTPVAQNISVYYGDLVYGGVGFAILSDRQWKSGPEHVQTGGGRPDHVDDPHFDTATLDRPGLVLLGERQETFLEQWVNDWRGHTMKVLLSQTVFAGAATHHGRENMYLKADLDSGGWPQTPRQHALRILRAGQLLHINGDQHLASLLQYGIDAQRDGGWSFCTPAIAVGYPRWWRPDELNLPVQNRPAHGLPNTGEYLDGLGNRMYLYAIGNPEVASEKQRYALAHQKGSGFGLVTIDPSNKTYHVEAFRFLIDATDGRPDNQFPGWPVTIHQAENRGENRLR